MLIKSFDGSSHTIYDNHDIKISVDSDAMFVRGLLYLLKIFVDGKTKDEILNINEMELTEGYYIRVNEYVDLNAAGIRPEYPLEVTLNTGWNILGYPFNYSQSALDVLQNLLNDEILIKVQNESGQAIEDLPFIGLVNQIGNFEPGEGYYIKVSEETSITYENNPALSSVINNVCKTKSSNLV